MLIKRLTIEGFRIIGNKITLDFPSEGKIGIFGHNEAGKSSIFEAIEFALFGITRRTKDDLVTWGKNKLEVVLEFSSGNKQFRIERALGLRGLHKVKFVQIHNEKPVPNTESNTVTSVEQHIEEILGMDKTSYSNLIYIRQKELDSLKDLQKRDREKLINKVMGIDDFDSANEIVKTDTKKNNTNLEALKQQLEFLKKSHDTYLANETEIKKLDEEIDSSDLEIKKFEQIESRLKSKLEEYELKKNYQQKKNTLKAQKSEENTLRSQVKKIQEGQDKLEEYQKLKNDVEPKYNNLKRFKEKFEKFEIELDVQNSSFKQQDVEPSNSLESGSKNITNRTSSLKKGIAFLLSGIFVAIFGIITPFLVPFGIILIIISIFYLNRYRKIGITNLIQDVKNKEKLDRKKLLEDNVAQLKNNISELRAQSHFESSGGVEFELEKLNSILQAQTGLETLEKLQGVIVNLSSSNEEAEINQLSGRVTDLENKNIKLGNELIQIEKEKPSDLNLESNLEEYTSLIKENEENKVQLVKSCSILNNAQGRRDQLKKENSNIHESYKQYPKELANQTKIESEIKLLDFLVDRFKEISAKMRKQVIPHAVNLISTWLPRITNNRYFSLEISEDLKFQVYEDKVGGYKERDLFSGGTQDQFLIALRLAFTKSILDNRTRADEYSLFMDEATSSSDFIRKQGIFDLLDEVKETFKQIFIIAHEDISNSVDYHLILQNDNDGFTSIKYRSW